MANNIKTSETILRVSGLLLQLLQNAMSYQEMFDFYNKNFKTPIYSKEVLNKYLNTLRIAGLDIERYNGKYVLFNFLTQVILTEEEINTFKKFEQTVLRYGTTKNIQTFWNFKTKFIKFLDTNSRKAINFYNDTISLRTKLGVIIKQYNEFCEDGQKIKIKYDGKVKIVEPEQVIFTNNKIYLECIDTSDSKIKKLDTEKIKFLGYQPSKNTYKNSENVVIYEISGRLAQIYKLKEGETILAQSPEKLFIKNCSEDYEFLSHRLIRYQNCCKILKPIEFKEYFKNYINEILNIYEKK